MADAAVLFDAPASGRASATRAKPRRLGKNANNSSPAARVKITTPDGRARTRRLRRRERYALRSDLRSVTTLERVKKCGYCSIAGSDVAGVGLRVGELNGQAVAGFTGLATCGSVWACPACSAKIATRRADELSDLMRYALEQGCTASMVTLTMRHHKGQTLRDCWDGIGKAWATVTSGKQWVADKRAAGLQGWVKAVEVTHGKNGWHVHIHVLMVWRNRPDQVALQTIVDGMWNRWHRSLARSGYDSLRDSGGLDFRMASLSPNARDGGLHEYFVKLSHEITGGQGKLAKGKGRTPFQLLTDCFEGALADDFERWWEWEEASRGRRQMAWSKGFREWAQLGVEQSDEEIAAEDVDGTDLLMMPADSWRAIRSRPDMVCDLLDVTERVGLLGASLQLDEWGLTWFAAKLPPPLPPHPEAVRSDVQSIRDIHQERLARADEREAYWRNILGE